MVFLFFLQKDLFLHRHPDSARSTCWRHMSMIANMFALFQKMWRANPNVLRVCVARNFLSSILSRCSSTLLNNNRRMKTDPLKYRGETIRYCLIVEFLYCHCSSNHRPFRSSYQLHIAFTLSTNSYFLSFVFSFWFWKIAW